MEGAPLAVTNRLSPQCCSFCGQELPRAVVALPAQVAADAPTLDSTASNRTNSTFQGEVASAHPEFFRRPSLQQEARRTTAAAAVIQDFLQTQTANQPGAGAGQGDPGASGTESSPVIEIQPAGEGNWTLLLAAIDGARRTRSIRAAVGDICAILAGVAVFAATVWLLGGKFGVGHYTFVLPLGVAGLLAAFYWALRYSHQISSKAFSMWRAVWRWAPGHRNSDGKPQPDSRENAAFGQSMLTAKNEQLSARFEQFESNRDSEIDPSDLSTRQDHLACAAPDQGPAAIRPDQQVSDHDSRRAAVEHFPSGAVTAARKKAGFDASKPFVLSILSGGDKKCEVRFPSDEEWCEWVREQRTMQYLLGRGRSQSEEVDLPKINAQLFAEIRTDLDGPEFDDAEASMVIGRIKRCTATKVEREGINYRIEMKVPGAHVVHLLRIPTAKDVQDHERSSSSVVTAPRSIETRTFLEPSGALYDKLQISHDGYAGEVPIVHKSAAVAEVIAQLAIDADRDPE
jgi:hypothetical protein